MSKTSREAPAGTPVIPSPTELLHSGIWQTIRHACLRTRQFRLPFAAATRFTALSVVMIASCGRDSTGARVLAEMSRKDDTRFAIASPNAGSSRFRVATSSPGPLTICASANGAQCDASARTPMMKIGDISGSRFLYESSNDYPLSDAQTWQVFDGSGTQLSAFRLLDRQGDVNAAALRLATTTSLRRELELITHDRLEGRLSATPENEIVADWIIEQLRRLDIAPLSGQDYRQRFKMTVGPTSGLGTSNIAAVIEGSDPNLKQEYVVIGAHMDHTGTLQRGYTCSRGAPGDDICNGADDNGSGTIAVLNVARALAATRHTLKRSVILMWFSGEEEGLLGSYHYVRNPLRPLNKTVYMINMDMVGYMKTFNNSLAALGGGSSPVGKAILENIATKYPNNRIRVSDRAGGGSDHVPFMSRGIPGVFFHTGVSNNPHYHKTTDSAEKIDYPGMLMATQVAYETVWRVAGASFGGQGGMSLTSAERPSLVTEEEMTQSCHSLIKNPFIHEMRAELSLSVEHLGIPYRGH